VLAMKKLPVRKLESDIFRARHIAKTLGYKVAIRFMQRRNYSKEAMRAAILGYQFA
jgi:hypothetical protein